MDNQSAVAQRLEISRKKNKGPEFNSFTCYFALKLGLGYSRRRTSEVKKLVHAPLSFSSL